MSLKNWAASVALLSLVACSSNPPAPPQPPPPPPLGQWTCFSCSGMLVNADGSFSFPNSSGLVGYIFTSVSGNPIGKTATLDYTVSGYPPTTFGVPAAAGAGSATFRLLLWEKGDDLSCSNQFTNYRWFAPPNGSGSPPIAFGEAMLSAVLTPAQWSNCYGLNGTTVGGGVTAGFNTAVGNLLGIGFVCGAEFFGHGCYANGPATFKINSFKVQ